MRDARSELLPLRPAAPIPRLALRQHEAAAALGVTTRTLRSWTRAGKVRAIRAPGGDATAGRSILYPVSELQAFLEREAACDPAGADGDAKAAADDAQPPAAAVPSPCHTRRRLLDAATLDHEP